MKRNNNCLTLRRRDWLGWAAATEIAWCNPYRLINPHELITI